MSYGYTGIGLHLWCCFCGQHKPVAGGRSQTIASQRLFSCADCEDTAAFSPVNGEAQAASNSPGLISQPSQTGKL